VFVPEVLSGLGDSLAVEANDNAAKLLIAMSDVEVNLSDPLASIHSPIQDTSIPCA
jgi:hypothetical protein